MEGHPSLDKQTLEGDDHVYINGRNKMCTTYPASGTILIRFKQLEVIIAGLGHKSKELLQTVNNRITYGKVS